MEEAYSRIKAELEKQDDELRRETLLEHKFEESYATYNDKDVSKQESYQIKQEKARKLNRYLKIKRLLQRLE